MQHTALLAAGTTTTHTIQQQQQPWPLTLLLLLLLLFLLAALLLLLVLLQLTPAGTLVHLGIRLAIVLAAAAAASDPQTPVPHKQAGKITTPKMAGLQLRCVPVCSRLYVPSTAHMPPTTVR
jgi:hypothetical protein